MKNESLGQVKTLILDKVDTKIQYDENTIKKLYNQANHKHKNKKYKEAWPIFCDLASANHKISIFYFSYYHENGYIGPKNMKKALEYYRESADAGYGMAAYVYAEASLKTAHEYMKNAAKDGYFKSGVRLAEWLLPELWELSLSQETCDKCNELLSYLNADENNLQKQNRKP